MFTIVPRASALLIIEHFNLSGDVIDLRLFWPEIRSRVDLETRGGVDVEVGLVRGQLVRILNLSSDKLLQDRNFLFVGNSTTSSESKFDKTVSVALGATLGTLGLLLIGCVGRFYYYSWIKARELLEAERTVNRVLKRRQMDGECVVVGRDRRTLVMKYDVSTLRMSRWNEKNAALDGEDSSDSSISKGNISNSRRESSSVFSYDPIAEIWQLLAKSNGKRSGSKSSSSTKSKEKRSTRNSSSDISYQPMKDINQDLSDCESGISYNPIEDLMREARECSDRSPSPAMWFSYDLEKNVLTLCSSEVRSEDDSSSASYNPIREVMREVRGSPVVRVDSGDSSSASHYPIREVMWELRLVRGADDDDASDISYQPIHDILNESEDDTDSNETMSGSVVSREVMCELFGAEAMGVSGAMDMV